MHFVLQIVFGQHDARRAEGVGLDHVATDAVERGVDVPDDVGRLSTRISLQPSLPQKSSTLGLRN